MDRLLDKVVIITGASQGMGAATAKLFAEEGAVVIAADINVKDGESLVNSLGERAHFEMLDVANSENWNSLVNNTIKQFGQIDGLINNAAIFFDALIEDTDQADLVNLLNIDLVGPWLGMKAVVPFMKKARRGSIVNISSVEGLIGHCGRTAYTAAKWGMRGMTKSLAMEVGPYGVRVNTIEPGAISTPMLEDGLAAMGNPDFDAVFPQVAMSRPGSAREVAAASMYLISDDSTYVTGADLTIDGGWTCGNYSGNKPIP